jgi:diguanylate cyclase (GGDEF)-like protein/PAS domain S-box-containing protein
MKRTAGFLASLLDNVTEQILVLDPATLKILYANKPFRAYYGLSPAKLRGKRCHEVTHRSPRPCDENGCECPVKQVIDTGEPAAATHVHAGGDGSRTVFRLDAHPVSDRKGRITHVVETSRDISDQVALQESLRKKSELFETILQTSPDGIIGSDRKGNVFLYNAGAEQIYGYAREEVVGKINVSELYPPGGAREVKEFIYSEHYGGRGGLQDFETEVLAKDGRRVPIRISCALLSEKGIEVGTIGFFHDISARKALKQLLLESEESFRSIFESANDAIVSIGETGEIVKANRAAEEMLRYAKGELPGRNIRDVLPEEYMEVWGRIRTSAPQGKTGPEAKHVELSARTKTGEEIPVHVSLSESRTRKKSLVTAILRDISERKAFEEELRLLSITDSLTKLFNRRHFLSVARKEMERADRTRVPFSLLLIDVDRFKNYNDSYGHTEGDRLLAAIAELARGTFREMDSIFRFGGEEFVVLLPDTLTAGAVAAAERFRGRLAATDPAPPQAETPVHATVSIGVAEYRAGITLDDLVRQADLAMYAAKKGGRNQTVSYDRLLAPSPAAPGRD